ncbi:MAG: S8 family serine peptidase [bacterium]
MHNLIKYSKKLIVPTLCALFLVVTFSGNMHAKIIDWGGVQVEEVPGKFYMELNKEFQPDHIIQIAEKLNLEEEKTNTDAIDFERTSKFVYKASKEFKGDHKALLKQLKNEKALKVVNPVYKRSDLEEETALTYSDLIIVFFSDGSCMEDIETTFIKKELILEKGMIDQDFREFKQKSKSFQMKLEKELAEVEERDDDTMKSYLLQLKEKASENNYGDIRIFRLKHPKKQDAFDICAELEEYDAVTHAYPLAISMTKSSLTTYPNDMYFGAQWHYRMINCHYGWDLTHGSTSVVIAIIDSGIDMNHPDLKAELVPGCNTLNFGTDPVDDYGHGTCVAGLASARTNNYTGIAGVGWNCRIMPIKVMNSAGVIEDEIDIAFGLYFARINGADIVNLSIGWNGPHNYIEWQLYYCFIEDVFCVAATGNEDTAYVSYPARSAFTVAIGAVDYSGKRVTKSRWGWGSNYGYDDYGYYAVHCMAPGLYLYTTSPSYYVGPDYTLNYRYPFYGTSGACPHVAGLAGLLRAKKPSLDNLQTFECILATCKYLGSPYEYGCGLVDAYGALNYAINHF